LIDGKQSADTHDEDSLQAFIQRSVADLTAYQTATYASRYKSLLKKIAAREEAAIPSSSQLQRAVARYLFKVMVYKDEYEVARLQTDGELLRSIGSKFEGDYKLHFYLSPRLITAHRRRDRHAQEARIRPLDVQRVKKGCSF
jgi:indolepyruvate ferredoxin oxidoreductase